MGNYPVVSCIIIFWNAERFLLEAIQSVLAQSYSEWELLLVDDGSTDGSREIALHAARQHPHQITYLAHPGRQNRGMSATRNLGLRHARGKYIAFLDADDVWATNKLREQVQILEREPRAGMVYGRTLIWHSWTGDEEDPARDEFVPLGVKPNTLVEPPRLFYLMLANKVQSPTTCNAMIRRTLVEQVGGFEEHFRGMYEDQVFFAKVELATPVYVAGACWAKYRQHATSCSATSAAIASYEATRRPFLAWLKRYVAGAGMEPSSPIWRAIQHEAWLCEHPTLRRTLEMPGMAVATLRATLGAARGAKVTAP